MKTRDAIEHIHATADHARVRTAEASEHVEHRGRGDATTKRAAGAMGRVSDSLARMAEAAHVSGLAVRDRARDSARALSRGERILRREGFSGAAARAALRARRHLKTAAVVGGSIVVVVLLRRRIRGER